MIDVLKSYLVQNKSINIPGLGTIHAEEIPAKNDIVNKQLLPPHYVFHFDKYFDAVKTVIEELDKEGLRPRIRVLVGGAPITKDWAEKIKADGTSEDAVGAVKLAKQLLGKE